MYVLQFVKVAVLIPLTFVVQSPEVQNKRKFYLRLLGFAEYFVYLLIITNMVIQLSVAKRDYYTSSLSFNVLSIIITIALYMSLRKITYYTKTLSSDGI